MQRLRGHDYGLEKIENAKMNKEDQILMRDMPQEQRGLLEAFQKEKSDQRVGCQSKSITANVRGVLE